MEARKAAHLLSRRQWILSAGIFPLLVEEDHAIASQNALGDLAAEEGNVIYIDLSTKPTLSPAELKVLANNLKIQGQNQVPQDYPSFVREGFDIKILADGYSVDQSGLIYKDYVLGSGRSPQDGEQVKFEYTGYNENGARIDSTYSRGYPAETQLGVGGLIPGFEVALKGMQVGGRRRFIVPPELGPPVGPATFFSAKQCEVFDVELLDVKSCRRTSFAMFSGLVCE